MFLFVVVFVQFLLMRTRVSKPCHFCSDFFLSILLSFRFILPLFIRIFFFFAAIHFFVDFSVDLIFFLWVCHKISSFPSVDVQFELSSVPRWVSFGCLHSFDDVPNRPLACFYCRLIDKWNEQRQWQQQQPSIQPTSTKVDTKRIFRFFFSSRSANRIVDIDYSTRITPGITPSPFSLSSERT